MRLKAILFDKDGTFVDFHATWGPALDQAMRTLAGGDEAALERLAYTNRFDLATRRLRPTSPFIAEATADFARRWAAALGRDADAAFHREMDRLLDAGALANATPLGAPERVFPILRRAGYRLGVITNDTEAGARNQCARLALSDHLEAIVGYDSGHGRKPAPGQILHVARLFGLAPQEIAMVGDTLHDMAAARAAGVVSIAVTSGFAGREELAPHADHVIDGIDALPGLLGLQSSG